ncbi:hypothetical protein BGZ61DRAFT_475977 [Ilyonectria robusta]|uniref:uncharacterized protein n=1 Tax=Ilyonectria robusta TaxID=1079257 RepID=UPI001E8DA855|nr:uncharacterized protein BGZ61DRAFT_475977 [Ilyonectria robusta]KAH8722067.1 hypothetical protein BGZ61DRAFT_475977 [Ilyonectria robusta]
MGLAKIDKDPEIWFLRRQNAKRHILTMAQMTMEGYSWVKYLSQQVLTVSERTAPPPAPRGRRLVSRAVTRDQAPDERTICLMAWALRSYLFIPGLHATRERLTGSSVDVPTPQVQRGEDHDEYYAACGAKGSGEVGDDERGRKSGYGDKSGRSGPFGSGRRHLRQRQAQGARCKAQIPTIWRMDEY